MSILRQPLFVPFFGALVVLAGVEHAAEFFSWYYFFWWMDIITHTLGGLAVGLAALWLALRLSAQGVGAYKALCAAVAAALFIGICWEFFEYFSGTFIDEHIFPDTAYDLFADLAGGLIAYWYALRRGFLLFSGGAATKQP